MDGTLGVLVGITICGLAYCIDEIVKQRKLIIELQNSIALDIKPRIVVLEKRKALLAEAAVAQEKPSGVGKRTLRTWNENVGQAE